jgi:hypothetical protein
MSNVKNSWEQFFLTTCISHFSALTALAPGWEGLAADGAAKKGADTFSCFLEQNLTRF